MFLLKLKKIPLLSDEKGKFFKRREIGAQMASGAVFFDILVYSYSSWQNKILSRRVKENVKRDFYFVLTHEAIHQEEFLFRQDILPGGWTIRVYGVSLQWKNVGKGHKVGFVVLSKIRDGRDFYFKFENSLHKLHAVLKVWFSISLGEPSGLHRASPAFTECEGWWRQKTDQRFT